MPITKPMDTLAYIAVVSEMLMLLMHSGLATLQPPVESMTYQMTVTDLTKDFSIQATTYFSQKHQAYRYDFSGGMNKVFIYPTKGQLYYYYPSSDFVEGEFNVTKCWSVSTAQLESLPSPFPSLKGFTELGPQYVYDTPAVKYISERPQIRTEIWVEENEPKTGLHQRPVRKVIRVWIESGSGLKQSLMEHVVTEFFAFSTGEQHPSVWDRPSVTCQETSDNVVRTIISNLLYDISAPEMLFPNFRPAFAGSRPQTKYMTGRRSFTLNVKNDLQRKFPYTQAQYESIAKKLPTYFDWRVFGAVTQVKNQRNCGNCWAHGTVGSLESAYFLKHNKLVTLSEQAMTDCAGAKKYHTNGCYGGYEQSGFSWVNQTGGIPPTEVYSPYQETNGYCRISDQTALLAQLEGYYQVPNNTDALKVALVKLGPIVVSVDAAPMESYTTGVIEDCDYHNIDHSILLVGYGESAKHGPYWIIKNSWDTTWGLEGYGLISAKGNCISILDEAYFPVLK